MKAVKAWAVVSKNGHIVKTCSDIILLALSKKMALYETIPSEGDKIVRVEIREVKGGKK